MISLEELTTLLAEAEERKEIAQILLNQAAADVKETQELLQLTLRYYSPESAARETRKKNRVLSGKPSKKEICLDYLFNSAKTVRVEEVSKETGICSSTVRNALCEAAARDLCKADGLGNYWV